MNANFIIRGLRDSHDFKFERNIAQINKKLNADIETIFIITPPEYSHISSSILREIVKNGGDISEFIPKEIELCLGIENDKQRRVNIINKCFRFI